MVHYKPQTSSSYLLNNSQPEQYLCALSPPLQHLSTNIFCPFLFSGLQVCQVNNRLRGEDTHVKRLDSAVSAGAQIIQQPTTLPKLTSPPLAASTTGSTHAAGRHNIALLSLFSKYSNGALNPPRIVASATHSRGPVPVAGVGVETVVRPLPTPVAVYSIICLRQTSEKGRLLSTYGTRTRRQLTAQQQQQLESFSPAPLRMLLRLPPRQESPGRCRGLFVFVIVQPPYAHHE